MHNDFWKTWNLNVFCIFIKELIWTDNFQWETCFKVFFSKEETKYFITHSIWKCLKHMIISMELNNKWFFKKAICHSQFIKIFWKTCTRIKSWKRKRMNLSSIINKIECLSDIISYKLVWKFVGIKCNAFLRNNLQQLAKNGRIKSTIVVTILLL